ncbi:hypothetical protein PHYC_03849 [Phycisphaerales bacterium]|nr:hypothetical protein PHYC_03849 [Phycisphaerales bacterium]
MTSSTEAQSTSAKRVSKVRAAAQTLDVSTRTIWRLLAQRELTQVRVGRSVRITNESIEQFIQRGGAR